MNNKGLDAETIMNETPNIINDADKPLKREKILTQKVDINVLKARAKAIQDKENIKNTVVIIFFIVAIGTAGIYFSI